MTSRAPAALVAVSLLLLAPLSLAASPSASGALPPSKCPWFTPTIPPDINWTCFPCSVFPPWLTCPIGKTAA